MKKKIISFSLWGSEPKYTLGMLKNAELAPMIYPGWICRVYVGEGVPDCVVQKLSSLPHCELIPMAGAGWQGALWRFLPAGDKECEVMISRDADSRLSEREALAVSQWLASPYPFHIMRDHPAHNASILGGMWGAKEGILADIGSLIFAYEAEDCWQTDQNFLASRVYPLIQSHCLIHDEFFGGRPFPSRRRNFEFVGEVFDEEGRYSDSDREEVRKALVRLWYRSPLYRMNMIVAQARGPKRTTPGVTY